MVATPPPAERSRRGHAFVTIAGLLIPGVRRVHAQVEPYAAAWDRGNAAALQTCGPLWVALGDSMTQGIGARSIEGGWVGQLRARLAAEGHAYRVVNLSSTGARVRDVVDAQLPAMEALGLRPDLVTVLVGANDMMPRSRRPDAVRGYAELLPRLPAGVSVVCELPRRNREAVAINAQIERAAAAGRIQSAQVRELPLREVFGTLAEDFFHPNERGYAGIADTFERAIGPMLGPGAPGPP